VRRAIQSSPLPSVPPLRRSIALLRAAAGQSRLPVTPESAAARKRAGSRSPSLAAPIIRPAMISRTSLPGMLNLFESGFESFAHRRDRFRSERSGLHQWTNLHGRRSSTAHAMILKNN